MVSCDLPYLPELDHTSLLLVVPSASTTPELGNGSRNETMSRCNRKRFYLAFESTVQCVCVSLCVYVHARARICMHVLYVGEMLVFFIGNYDAIK